MDQDLVGGIFILCLLFFFSCEDGSQVHIIQDCVGGPQTYTYEAEELNEEKLTDLDYI
jgi:hypothetical protein